MLLQLSVPRNTGNEIVVDTIHLPSFVHESKCRIAKVLIKFISHVTGYFLIKHKILGIFLGAKR